jgi:hypothetical protein
MAREGYLILDSDLHMMEPDDLWTRYLDEPFRSSNPPRFLSAQQQQLTPSSEDKGNADRIEGIEVQGLAIPAHGKSPSAAASRRELRRRSRAGHPNFAVARARRFDASCDLDGNGYRGDRRRGHVWHARSADPTVSGAADWRLRTDPADDNRQAPGRAARRRRIAAYSAEPAARARRADKIRAPGCRR